MADTPDWLQQEADSNNGVAKASSSFAVPPPPNPSFLDGDNTATTTNNNEATGCCRSKVGTWTLYLISSTLLGVFLFSATVQNNDDDDRMLWILFYSLHAALSAFYLMAHLTTVCCSRYTTTTTTTTTNTMTDWWYRWCWLVAVGTMGYTGFMLWRSVKDYRDDKDEETTLEVGGAALGGASILYHALIWKFWSPSSGRCGRGNDVGKKNTADDDDDDEGIDDNHDI